MANNQNHQLPTAVAAALLQKLGSDDTFRHLFQQDVVAALKQAGASDAEAESCGHCLRVTKLADKASILENSPVLNSMLTASMGFQPHKLGIR